MNNSKLVELYKTLATIEKKQFGLYVNSPFFNTNRQVIRLNQYIHSAIETNKEDQLDKTKTFIHLFGKGKYDKQKVSTVMTFLMSLLENFISQQKIDKKHFLQKEQLLIELRERNLDKHFISNSNDYHTKLQKKEIQDSNYFYEHYVLERELDQFFLKKAVRKNDESLQHMSDNLDTFYLSEKLKNLCEMVNRKNIIGAEYDLKLLKELLAYIHENTQHFRTIPAVYIYYKILLLLLESEKPLHFTELKQALDKCHKLFSKEEAQLMYLYPQNYCIKKINSGKSEYLLELFSINEALLTGEIIFEGKYLSQWDYKNMISVGLKLNKFEWTKGFIEQYKIRMAPEFRQNAYEYNLALFHFAKKDFKSALKLLQLVEFTDVFYHIGSKSMLLKIYYESEEVESFYSLVDAFKVYLVRNKKISVYQRQMYQNLLKYTKQAFNLKVKTGGASIPSNEKAVKKLKAGIERNKNQADFSWLLERVNELAN